MPTNNDVIQGSGSTDEFNIPKIYRIQCDCCSTEYDERHHILTMVAGGDEICESCRDDHYEYCSNCSEYDHGNNMHSAPDGTSYCSDGCFYDYCFHCDGCEDVGWTDEIYYNESDGCNYCEYCYQDNDEEDYYEWSVFSPSYVSDNDNWITPSRNSYKEDTFNLIKSKRYQGVEIECNDHGNYSRRILEKMLARKIDDTREVSKMVEMEQETHPHWSRISGLDITSDGSITGGDDEYGYEYVLKPRRGDVLFTDLQTITQALIDSDCYISRKCGYHLHIDIRDYDWYHLTTLLAMTKLIEPHIYSWCPISRLKGNWCNPVSQSWYDIRHISGREKFIEQYYDGDRKFRTDKYHDKRYHGLNLHSHFGTNQGVELRYHAGTLNATKMLHWSIFWSQVVDKCWEIGENIRGSDFFDGLTSREDIKVSDENSVRSVSNLFFDRPTMDIKNVFDTFDIPQITRDFYAKRQIEIQNNPATPSEHFQRCFHKTTHFVEFDKEKLNFKTIKKLPHRTGYVRGDLKFDDISQHFVI